MQAYAVRRLGTYAFTIALALTALAACAADPYDPNASNGDEVIGGVATFQHPEIGRLAINGRGCTGTLVGSRVVITASHCIHENWSQPDFPLSGRVDGTFTVETDASTSNVYRVSQYHSYSHTTGADDISIVQLADDVPISVAVPSMLSWRGFRTGDTLILYGYGCNALDPTTGGGVKRKFVTRAVSSGTPSTMNLCPGDSGGPLLSTDGIVRINSAIHTADHDGNGIGDTNTGDIYADPLSRRSELMDMIHAFQTSAPLHACSAYTTLSDCDADGCAWYACSNTCAARGTDVTIACPDECRSRADIGGCTASPGCAWYACSNSCWGRGTAIDTACPPAAASCRAEGQSCGAASDCCPGLSCSMGACALPTSSSVWDCARSGYGGSQYWTCSGGTLYRCEGGVAMSQSCEAGCLSRPLGTDDLCISNTTGWDCARSAYAGSQYWTCSSGSIYRCNGGSPTVVRCPSGCTVHPVGTDDTCS